MPEIGEKYEELVNENIKDIEKMLSENEKEKTQPNSIDDIIKRAKEKADKERLEATTKKEQEKSKNYDR